MERGLTTRSPGLWGTPSINSRPVRKVEIRSAPTESPDDRRDSAPVATELVVLGDISETGDDLEPTDNLICFQLVGEAEVQLAAGPPDVRR